MAKSFKCDFCGKNCIAQSQLDIHMWSHTSERPFKCQPCDKSFRRYSHLYMHVQRHTGDSDFKWTQCDKSFPQKVELKQHEKLHTGLITNWLNHESNSRGKKGSLYYYLMSTE